MNIFSDTVTSHYLASAGLETTDPRIVLFNISVLSVLSAASTRNFIITFDLAIHIQRNHDLKNLLKKFLCNYKPITGIETLN